MTSSTLNTDSLMYITDRPQISMVRGEGSWLWDQDGRRYLDFVQGWAVNSLGHSPRIVVDAIKDQAERLLNPSPSYYNPPMLELADLIASNSALDKTFFTNCGAEANEGAIKLARKWGQIHKGGAFEIIAMDHAFHGRTLATMSASGKPQWRDLYEPKVQGFPRVPLNDIDAVRTAMNENTVAVMLEPIQGEAGVYPVDDGYMRELRRITEEANVLLIVDEVQTGVGRTGKLFAYEWSGIRPDIMTLAKGIGGGVPLGALVARQEVCCFAAGDQGGTFNGNPLVTAAGCAVMKEVCRPEFLANVNTVSRYLTEGLVNLSRKHGFGEVRGRGLLLALNLNRELGKIITQRALENGLLINSPRAETLRFMPALNVTTDEIEEMLRILESTIGSIV